MIGRKINEAFSLNSEHTFFFHGGDWYHHLKRFPGILADLNGYVKFETEEEYLNNPNLKHGQRLHIDNGIQSLENYVAFTGEQLYILNQIITNRDSLKGIPLDKNNQAERKPINVDSIIRNQSLVRKVKGIRDNTCQICSKKLKIGPNSYYSEVHHIRPLGKPHNGPDIISNMLCVCPNCHKKLDYGFTPIEFKIVNLKGHKIDDRFILYHNNQILKR